MTNADDKKAHPKNLRGMVSKQKRRYQDGNYDLDLSCILLNNFFDWIEQVKENYAFLLSVEWRYNFAS